MNTHDNVIELSYNDKKIILVGTAHISKESTALVEQMINLHKPDSVCVELCESRYQSIVQKDKWENTDIVKVIKEKKAFLLLSNLLLASFQKRMAKKFDVQPGGEMIKAVSLAKEINAELILSDRDIRTTLSRTWRKISFFKKLRLFSEVLLSGSMIDDITEEDIEKLKTKDMLDSLLNEISQALPELRLILIDERDQYLCEKIRTAPGQKIVAIVGAGHMPGIQSYWHTHVDIKELESQPPPKKLTSFMKWIIPISIILIIMAGFFQAGVSAGTEMIKLWIIANSLFAGIGAAVAFAHPITIVSAIIAAPITSLNPMIAAGWVSGLVEAFVRKPKVKDFQTLSEDIVSFKGFWHNKITRILLVVIFTNIGSSIGTFAAIPLMARIL